HAPFLPNLSSGGGKKTARSLGIATDQWMNGFQNRSPHTHVRDFNTERKQPMSILGNGKDTKRSLGLLVLTSAALALGACGTSSAATADSARSGLSARIEGTWILNIDRVTQGFSFTALQSFTAGGVTVATGTIDRTPPPPLSPLY